MKLAITPIKTTILGGLVFLVPCIIVILLVAEAFKVMGLLAAPLSTWIPVDSIGGIATANIITVLAILIVCFLAGLVATSGVGRRIYRSMDDKLLMLFPRYAFVKSMTESMSADEVKKTLQPVRVTFDDHSQIAFEVERDEQGLVTVFLPGAPDPWSGSVAQVTNDRIEDLDTNFNAVVQSLRKAGRGASQLLG
jgi:uncharacterized membrane protein